jgi:tetratricopeptide (TPR) repeat protein
MRYYDSDEFKAQDAKLVPAGEPLVVHRRPGAASANLVVFVHGLGGLRYGTWGSFPKFVFDDFKQASVDVGLYGYRTAFRRLRFTASIDLDREATVCADVIRDLPAHYRRIVLIAHSMGGLLIKAAVKSLIDRNERLALARTSGLILMATPQAGSLRVPSFLGSFSRDARALKPHGELVTKITETFTDRVVQMPVPDDSGRFVIPVWAVITPEDLWVDRLSAGLQIPSPRRKEVRGSHTRIVKPEHYDADPYVFVKNAIAECLTTTVASAAPTHVAPAPLVNTRLTTLAPSEVLQPGPAIQVTQMSISLPLPTELGLQIVSQLTQAGLPVPLPVGGPSHAGLTQEAEPKPRVDELFEVITDPDEVPKALFRMEQTSDLAPYDVDYINAREAVHDVQQALETALREAKGRLLVCGPRGIGKTREIAELARTACATKWKVLVAHNEGNPRLGLLLTLPPELIDAKLLIIVDNLHTRIMAGTDQPTPPYIERLERLVEWLEHQLPGSVRVLAAARDEPHFQSYLDLPRDEKRWRSFGLFRLPKLTDEGLQQILATLAVRASVPVAADDIAKLIENSDRKPETVFINVDLARRKRTALTQSVWKPTEGESWQLRFVSARAEHAGVDRVCQALHLLTETGLPARVPYVISVARASGEQHPEAAIKALVDEGLLRMRQGILTPFSAEQLEELVGLDGASAVQLHDCAEAIEQSITDPDNRPQEWVDDLLALSLGLARANSTDRAEQVASHAVDLGAGGSLAYRIRSGIRFGRGDFPGAEGDLTKALEVDGDEADTHFLRATLRNLLANFTGALEDLDLAMQHGRDDSAVHAQRGTAYYQLARWSDAELELGAAIERGDTSGTILLTRGIARLKLNDAAGAEQDFSATLKRGIDLDDMVNQLREIGAGLSSELASPSAAGPASGNLLVYALRGFVRFRLGKNAAAEEDLTVALASGFGEHFRTFTDAMRGSTLPMLEHVNKQLKDHRVLFGEGPLFHIRGLTRLNQDKFVEAAADFDEALTRGYVEAEVYYGRGCARFRMEQFAEAEQDAAIALERGKEDALTHALRGVARLALQRFSEAEQDFENAIELDRDSAQLFVLRGAARCQQHKLEDAEADLIAALDRHYDARTLFIRGCMRLDLEKYVEAEQDLTAALDLGFDQVSLFTLRGLARLQQNKLTEADEDATAGFARGTMDVPAYSLRAAVRLEQERYAEAEPDLTAALELGRNDAWVLFNRGRTRQALERYAEAEQDYDAVIALGITEGDLFVNRGRTRLEQQKWPEAEQDFIAAINAGRDDAYVHFCLGRACQQQSRYLEAETEFDVALTRDNQPVFRTARGFLRLIRGNFHGAEDDFDEVIVRGPADANALFGRGLARYAQRKSADALADYNAALVLAPNNTEVLSSRVLVHLRLGHFDKAAEDCEQLGATDRDGPNTLGCYGVLHLARGEFDDALSRFRAAAQCNSSWYCWQGLACLMMGRLEEACQAYRQGAAASVPGDIVLALNELDFYLSQHPARAASQEAQAAVVLIRTELSQQVGPAHRQTV